MITLQLNLILILLYLAAGNKGQNTLTDCANFVQEVFSTRTCINNPVQLGSHGYTVAIDGSVIEITEKPGTTSEAGVCGVH